LLLIAIRNWRRFAIGVGTSLLKFPVINLFEKICESVNYLIPTCPLTFLFYLLTIIKAAITPGIHPHRVRISTSITEPQPLSITASGGKIIQRITRQIDIVFYLNLVVEICKMFDDSLQEKLQ